MRATKGLPARVRSSVRQASPPPWCTLAVLAAIVLVAAATLAPGAAIRARELAWEWSDGLAPGLLLWPLSHLGWWEVAVNTTVLLAFAPALERFVGPWRLATCLAAGNVGGLLAHLLLNLPAPPLLGASAMAYAVVSYSLVAGWHCPFTSRRGHRLPLWPAEVFHLLLAIEGLRWAVQVTTNRPPGSAAAHLGGIAAGVLVCGLLHHRWPAGLGSHRARGSGARSPRSEKVPRSSTEAPSSEMRNRAAAVVGIEAVGAGHGNVPGR
jgi:membrane associated rhomboid family serine protease